MPDGDVRGRTRSGMFESANPKCANPVCPTAFHWKKGGKFFRFRQEEVQEVTNGPEHGPPNLHHVEHFWLCARCSEMFTLVHAEGHGVVLRVIFGNQRTFKQRRAVALLDTDSPRVFVYAHLKICL